MHRKVLHPERLLQVFQHQPPVLVRIGTFLLLESVEKVLAGILGAQPQKRELVTLDRNPELDSINLDIRLERHDDFAGKSPELGLDLGYEGAQYRFLLLLDVHPEAQVQRLDDGSSPHPQEVAESILTVEHEREHVAVGSGRGGDDGLRIVFPERFYPFLADQGILEPELGGSLLHRPFIFIDDLVDSAFEQARDFIDVE